MKYILPFLCIGLALVYIGCSENNPAAPDVTQTVQAPASLAKPAPQLECTIVYWLAGPPWIYDSEGRRWVWDGEIHGDIEGQIKWWFVPGGGPPNMPPAAHVSFYEARWEIWDGEDLLLAGNSSGTTAWPDGKDGIWRGNGVVTEGSAEYEGWVGRRIFEGGNVSSNPLPLHGQGIFRLN